MLRAIKHLLKRNSLWLAILVTIAIALLSLIKIESTQPINIKYLDKLLHLISYVVLSFLWFTAFIKSKKIILVFISCIAYGVLLEFLQAQTGYRTYEYADMLANSLGVLIGYLIFSKLF